MAAHPVLLGDWNRWVRDGIDVLRLALGAGALVAALCGDLTSAVRLAVGCAASFIGRIARLPRPFGLLLVLGLGFDALGNALALYDSVWWYDKAVHFVLPLALAPALYLVLARLSVVPDLAADIQAHQHIGIALIAGTLGVTVGAFYEIYEYMLVHYLHADLVIGYADTIGDLVDDTIGPSGGAALLVLWKVLGWGTEWRVPNRTGSSNTEAGG